MTDLGAIERRVAEASGIVNAQTAVLLDAIADALDADLWRGEGIHSAAQWVAWQFGFSLGRARDFVRVARRRTDFPHTYRRFRDGELTFDQVAAVTRVEPAYERQLAGIARFATVHQIARIARAYTDHADTDEPAADAPSTLAFRRTPTGRLTGRFDLAADHGAIVEAALTEARDQLFHDGDTTVTWAGALVETAHRSLDTVTSPERRNRFRIDVHLDGDTATFTNGHSLPRPLVELLGCDADVQPIWERDSLPVSVGRTQRIVPVRTRRLVRRRDRGCRVPGCTNERWLDIHHIRHWTADDGPTDTWNLCCLCRHHHRLHHLGTLHITGNADDPDGLEFTGPDGRRLGPSRRAIPPNGPLPQPQSEYRHPTGERLDLRDVWLTPDHPEAA